MCAGGLREPRRKGTRVAAPSGCIVPWAARASCWPQPQQLLPVSAAGSGRRCCTGAFLPAGLFGGSMLFESTRPMSLALLQNKNLSVLYTLRLFGGRGWMSRAALLKTAHWAVFALSSATAPQLFEPTLVAPFSRQIKQKLQYPLDTGVLGGRGWIARAAHLKKPRRGFFTRRTIRRVDAVRIHPPYEFSLVTKQKPQRTCMR